MSSIALKYDMFSGTRRVPGKTRDNREKKNEFT